MIQCKIFAGLFPQNEVNTFLADNPNYRYVEHSLDGVIHQGNVWFTVVLFYEDNPHSLIRTGPAPAIFSPPAIFRQSEVPPSPGELPQWEYTSYEFICPWAELHFRLNEWGMEGWEAYNHISIKRSRSTIVFFKRKKISDGQAT